MFEILYINQGENDYLGAEISINNQIVCLIGIDSDLEIFIEFFHDYRISNDVQLKIAFSEFLLAVQECEKELIMVVNKLRCDV
ncbi:hypothetical protein [Moraxella cuniculi]|uniref:Uncharacterized protein n=1 Tax=Moraxella cuniculi TaxID=34061 RepID=A0A448GYT8_9GAMM|nr:hypothetical protein [Moraxella cuniculi]VEG13945.1 Uncharacterised protein [Moraxella cuniculi]